MRLASCGVLGETDKTELTPEARGRLTGTIVNHTTMNGELEDPIGAATGILGAGTCRYAATGLQ